MDFVNSFFHIPKKMLIVYFKFYHINGCCTAPINSTHNILPAYVLTQFAHTNHNLHSYTSKNCEIGCPCSLVLLSLRQSVRHVFEFTRSLFDYWKNILICSVS